MNNKIKRKKLLLTIVYLFICAVVIASIFILTEKLMPNHGWIRD